MWWFLNERTVFQEQILIYIFWKQCSFGLTPCSLAGFVQWQGCVVKLVPCPWVCPREAAIQHGLPLGEKECLIKKNALKEENINQSVRSLSWAIAGKHQGKWCWLFVIPWGLGQVVSPSASFPHTKRAHVLGSSVCITSVSITCRSGHLRNKKIHNQVKKPPNYEMKCY